MGSKPDSRKDKVLQFLDEARAIRGLELSTSEVPLDGRSKRLYDEMMSERLEELGHQYRGDLSGMPEAKYLEAIVNRRAGLGSQRVAVYGDEARGVSMSEQEWSVRARDVFAKAGIKTLGDLADYDAEGLLALKNFGETQVQEVVNNLRKYDLELKRPESGRDYISQPIGETSLPRRLQNVLRGQGIETVGQVAQNSRRDLFMYKGLGETSLIAIERVLDERGLQLQPDQRILEMPVVNADFTVRAKRAFQEAGIEKVGDLRKYSGNDLLGLGSIGMQTLKDIRFRLQKHGLKLKGDK